MDWFVRSLRHVLFDKEAISDGCRSENSGIFGDLESWVSVVLVLHSNLNEKYSTLVESLLNKLQPTHNIYSGQRYKIIFFIRHTTND